MKRKQEILTCQELLSEGESALVVHHGFLRGTKIIQGLNMEGPDHGSTQAWTTKPVNRHPRKVIILRDEEDGRSVWVGAYMGYQCISDDAGKWRYLFSGMRQVGISPSAWKEFIQKDHRFGSAYIEGGRGRLSQNVAAKRRGGNAPPKDPYLRVFGSRRQFIEPAHDRLQSAFLKYLNASESPPEISENCDYVDVVLHGQKRRWLVEVKPNSPSDSRYAIRAAVGQLLDYQWQRRAGKEKFSLAIVLSSQPTKDEIDFVNSLHMSVCWRDGSQFLTAASGGAKPRPWSPE